MSGIDQDKIRSIIDSNNKQILELLTTDHFTLNKRVSELMRQNQLLQTQCNHKFENGRCIYCDYEEAAN
jgi:hypothetical protein